MTPTLGASTLAPAVDAFERLNSMVGELVEVMPLFGEVTLVGERGWRRPKSYRLTQTTQFRLTDVSSEIEDGSHAIAYLMTLPSDSQHTEHYEFPVPFELISITSV